MRGYDLKGALHTQHTERIKELETENATLRSQLEIAQEAYNRLLRVTQALGATQGNREVM